MTRRKTFVELTDVPGIICLQKIRVIELIKQCVMAELRFLHSALYFMVTYTLLRFVYFMLHGSRKLGDNIVTSCD